MIIATEDGRFFSECASELDDYKWNLEEITARYARHLCKESEDYIVFRLLTEDETNRIKPGLLQVTW